MLDGSNPAPVVLGLHAVCSIRLFLVMAQQKTVGPCQAQSRQIGMIRKLGILLVCLIPLSAMSAEESAVVGGGCFWCIEAMFQSVPGIVSVTSGYAGGTTPDPTYKQVCSGKTGHAEVVKIVFDAAQIPYEKVIDLFWKAHDPTTLNRQGADIGTQYRSIILFSNAAQKEAAERSRAAAAKNFKTPIVTEIVPLTVFYPAESEHQDFYEKNPQHPYSRAVTAPKLEKFR